MPKKKIESFCVNTRGLNSAQKVDLAESLKELMQQKKIEFAEQNQTKEGSA